ncbi:hypothetical protein DAPPUDRAFT_328094 [Daphnia pulex]|uniref:Uncharacterized protein n=1 Tax=Daphnia pulex TaxID=6669 RepID=E9HCH5_DAPPU|nr:hypothetical protein DAPPUDRAFT_328094 [Daphnia pulex]|eukprot:EFX70517.1 hypothetical protein DAPPUDRAFT_328094 [Daphnia pulex]
MNCSYSRSKFWCLLVLICPDFCGKLLVLSVRSPILVEGFSDACQFRQLAVKVDDEAAAQLLKEHRKE